MARAMNALQLALGSVGSGIQGYTQARTLREEQEAKRQMFEAEQQRQREIDAAQMRVEERQAVGATGKMLPSSVFAKYTMPGAEPMQPALTQKIGGKDFAFSPEIAQAEAHREDVMKERGARMKKASEQTAIGEALAGITDAKGKKLFTDEQAQKYALLPSNERSSAVSAAIRAAEPRQERAGKAEPTDDEKRLLGAQVLSTGRRNISLINALSAVMAKNPSMANDPEMAAYIAWKSGAVQKGITANKGFEPKKAKGSSATGGAGSIDTAALEKEAEARMRAGGAPAQAPASKPSVQSAAPASTGSLADAADKEARRADRWDQIKAQNPSMSDEAITAQVKREIP